MVERRSKKRFAMERDVSYRILLGKQALKTGRGKTLDVSSSGVAFRAEHAAAPGAFMELSISWPAPLENGRLLRLVAFGRIIRSGAGMMVSSVEKYEFRTEAAAAIPGALALARSGDQLRRWAQVVRRESLRDSGFSILCTLFLRAVCVVLE